MPSPLRRNLLAGVFAVALLSAWLLSVPTYPNVIDIHKKSGVVKGEILSHIPIGTDIGRAAQFMRSNRFRCEWIKKGLTVDNGNSFYTPEDKLYCHREDGLFITRDCKIILTYKNRHVTSVDAHAGNTAP